VFAGYVDAALSCEHSPRAKVIRVTAARQRLTAPTSMAARAGASLAAGTTRPPHQAAILQLQAAAGNRATRRAIGGQAPVQRAVALRDQRFDPTADAQYATLAADQQQRVKKRHDVKVTYVFNDADHFWAWARSEPNTPEPSRLDVDIQTWIAEAHQRLDEVRPQRRFDAMMADTVVAGATGDVGVLSESRTPAETPLNLPGHFVVPSNRPNVGAQPWVTPQADARTVRARVGLGQQMPPHFTGYNAAPPPVGTRQLPSPYGVTEGLGGRVTASFAAGPQTRTNDTPRQYPFPPFHAGGTTFVRGHLQPFINTVPRTTPSAGEPDSNLTRANYTPENGVWGKTLRNNMEADVIGGGGGLAQREFYPPHPQMTQGSNIPVPERKDVVATNALGQVTAAYRFPQQHDYQADLDAQPQQNGGPSRALRAAALHQQPLPNAGLTEPDVYDPAAREWDAQTAAARRFGRGRTPEYVRDEQFAQQSRLNAKRRKRNDGSGDTDDTASDDD